MGCYKYLGVSLNNMLEWSTNKEVVYMKGLSSTFSGGSGPSWYAAVCSACFISLSWRVSGWGSAIKVEDVNRRNKLMRKAGGGSQQVSLEEMVEQRMLTKLRAITDNAPHPLHKTDRQCHQTF